MKNIIFDGENYYLFRALNDGNKADLEKGIDFIRTDCIRYYENFGKWGKYNDKSTISLEELYDHIKMRYRRDTNCISLSRDANVVLTYHTENPKYVLVKISPEKLREVVDAGEYFFEAIEEKVIEAENNIQDKTGKITKSIQEIEEANDLNEIRKILNEFNPLMSSYTINERQYLTDEEQLKMSKINAKLKILEHIGAIKNIIEDVPNSRLLATMGGAYTSCEYIHYGDILKEEIMDCPRIFIDIFSLLQQAKEKNDSNGDIDRVIKEVLELVKNKYTINERYRTFGNKKTTVYIDKDEFQFLTQNYHNEKEKREDLSIDEAFELANGRISYHETKMQLLTIQLLKEKILKKKALIDILKVALPNETSLEEILEDTYCINPEIVIKQNGRGHQLSSTVNLLINEHGYELEQKKTKLLLERVSSLSEEQLLEIYEKGIESEPIKGLLVLKTSKDQRIKIQRRNDINTKYVVEAIMEGYNWQKTRKLTKQENDTLAKKIAVLDVDGEKLRRLYNYLSKMVVEKDKFTESEICAIIINIAIDGKIGKTSFNQLLEMNEDEKEKILWKNAKKLQTIVNPISLDLLMKRGNTIKKLKEKLEGLGISKEFIEEKDVRNLYTANQIVEGYFCDTEIDNETKKALIYNILNTTLLNKGNYIYLSTMIRNFEKIGLTEQEIYGVIINCGINRISFDGVTYKYSSLLINSKEIFQRLRKYVTELDSNVSNATIQKAIRKSASYEEEKNIDEEDIKGKLEKLGISKEFIEEKDIKNLYIAHKIIEGYFEDEQIDNETKKNLLYSVLNQAKLNKGSGIYLSTLIIKLSELELTDKQIYGLIINMSAHGSALDYKGYSYTSLLSNKKDMIQGLEKHKDELETNVTNITIQKTRAEQLTEEEKEVLKQKLEKLGISREFMEAKGMQNVYMAETIVDGYFKYENIDNEVKKSLMQCILNNSAFEKSVMLSLLMRNFEKIGLNEEETYGAIINLGVKGGIVPYGNFGYSKLLNSSLKVKELKQYKSEIETEVSEETISSSLNIAKKVMRNSVKIEKDQGNLEHVSSTIYKLGNMAKRERNKGNTLETPDHK